MRAIKKLYCNFRLARENILNEICLRLHLCDPENHRFFLRRGKAVLCYFPPQAYGDLAERVIEATGTLSVFSQRASGHIR